MHEAVAQAGQQYMVRSPAVLRCGILEVVSLGDGYYEVRSRRKSYGIYRGEAMAFWRKAHIERSSREDAATRAWRMGAG
jgi:hypothetical protein